MFMWNKKTILAVIVILIAYLGYKYQSTSREGKLVKTTSGLVKGIISISRGGREFYEWLKVPFAQPPVGQLRFATPKPIGEWDGILDGSQYGPRCAQVVLFSNFIIGQEDCLHLNIHVPKLATKHESSKLLPVLFYIHGGAFVSLSAIDLAADYFMDEDVVVVTTNYRLGPLGFLSTGDKSIRGNMGLKDQAMALEFVKQNIENFGGDPQKITCFGESAGAVSLHLLMLSEKTRGLFHKAISMSGSALASWAFTQPEKAKRKSQSFATDLNCPVESSQEMVECLRKVDLNDILQVFRKDVQNFPLLNPTKRGDMISPTVEMVVDEETFLADYPYDLLVQGKTHPVPFLVGILRDEGLLASLEFKRDRDTLKYFEDNWNDCIEQALSLQSLSEGRRRDFAEKLAHYYLKNKSELSDQEKFLALTNMLSDGLFIVGTVESVTIQRRYASENIYLYYYNRTDGPTIAYILAEIQTRYNFIVESIIFAVKYLYSHFILGLPPQNYGVMHADDLHMMFPTLRHVIQIPKNDNDPNYKFSRDFIKLLVSFARDEKSIEFRGTRLPAVTKDGPLKYLELNDDTQPKIIDEPFTERMNLWLSLNYTQLFASKSHHE